MNTGDILLFTMWILILGCLVITPWIHNKITKHFGKNDWTEL
jgi:hypothetical protein